MKSSCTVVKRIVLTSLGVVIILAAFIAVCLLHYHFTFSKGGFPTLLLSHPPPSSHSDPPKSEKITKNPTKEHSITSSRDAKPTVAASQRSNNEDPFAEESLRRPKRHTLTSTAFSLLFRKLRRMFTKQKRQRASGGQVSRREQERLGAVYEDWLGFLDGKEQSLKAGGRAAGGYDKHARAQLRKERRRGMQMAAEAALPVRGMGGNPRRNKGHKVNTRKSQLGDMPAFNGVRGLAVGVDKAFNHAAELGERFGVKPEDALGMAVHYGGRLVLGPIGGKMADWAYNAYGRPLIAGNNLPTN